MSEAAEKLKPLLAALSTGERAEIVAFLYELDNGNGQGQDEEELSPEEWEAAWIEECDRRITDLDAGKTKAVPADEFMQRMKEKFG